MRILILILSLLLSSSLLASVSPLLELEQDEVGKEYPSLAALEMDQSKKGYVPVGNFGSKSFVAKVTEVQRNMNEIYFPLASGKQQGYPGFDGYELKMIRLESLDARKSETVAVFRTKRKLIIDTGSSLRKLKVTQVLDVDALKLSNGMTMRLTAIEMAPGAKKPPLKEDIILFLRESVEGQDVKVNMDPADDTKSYRDSSGRTLVYVFRTSDDFFLNGELVRMGYAIPDTNRFLI